MLIAQLQHFSPVEKLPFVILSSAAYGPGSVGRKPIMSSYWPDAYPFKAIYEQGALKKESWKISSNIAHLLAFLSHVCAFLSFSVSVTDPIVSSCIIAYCSISHIPLSLLLPNPLSLLQTCSLLSSFLASALSSQMLLLQHSLLTFYLPIRKLSPLCFPIFKQVLPLCEYPQYFIL